LLSHAIQSIELMLGIDLFVWNRLLLRRFGRPAARLSLLDGSSYAHGTVERAKKLLTGRAIDLLFIDGDHTYRGVAQDFLAYRALVREGGLVAFHDIVPDYMTRYGRATGRWAGDVPRFWSKIRPLFEHREFVEDPLQDGLGIGVIRYRKGVDLPFVDT
jgi:predicted O-methyltransferase YrrM